MRAARSPRRRLASMGRGCRGRLARVGGKRARHTPPSASAAFWIPAFAGMTGGGGIESGNPESENGVGRMWE